MDEKPFLEINMMELDQVLVGELKKLTKPAFNLDELMTTAGELKYTRQIKRLLSDQMEKPSDEFVKFFASKVFNGVLSPSRREYFAGITKRSFNQLINERINDRLKSAMSGTAGTPAVETAATPTTEPAPAETTTAQTDTPKREDLVQTSSEELEGFYIVKSLDLLRN